MLKRKKRDKENKQVKSKSYLNENLFPKRIQDIIKGFFREYDDQGTFRINDDEFSQTFEYKDISFSKAQYELQERIFLKWVDFLNFLSPNMFVSITNYSQSVLIDDYKKDYYYNNDEFKQLNDEFNLLIESSLGKDSIKIETKRYITVTLKAKDFDEARASFINVQLDFEKKFNEMKSSLKKIGTAERLSIIYDFFHDDPKEHLFDKEYSTLRQLEEKLEKEKCNIYDALSPKGNSEFNKLRYFKMNNKYFKVMFVKQLPSSLTPKFYHDISMKEFDKLITMNIQSISNAKALKLIKKTLGGIKTNRLEKIKRASKQGYRYEDVRDEDLEERYRDALLLQKDLRKNKQKMFVSNFIICLKADSLEELEANAESINNTASENIIELGNLNFMQIEGIKHALPLGHYSLPLKRTLTSEATAVNVPFNTCDILDKKAVWYGTNVVTKNGIFIDRKKMVSGNASVLASTGGGKSFLIKSMCEQIALRYPTDEIIICDFQDEYTKMVNYLKGQVIELSLESKTYLDPLDINIDCEDGDPVKSKSEYMLAFYESIVGNGLVPETSKSIIDRCVNHVFEKYEMSGFKNNDLKPLLTDLAVDIKNQPEEEAKNIALTLERFTTGSLDIFSKPTNVDINKKIISFSLKKVPGSIRTTAYLVLMEHIKNRVATNYKKGIWTWIVFDEGHFLLSNSYSSHYTNELYKTIRKFDTLPTFITQNVRTMIENKDGRDMLSNSDLIVVLRQKKKDLEVIENLYSISNDEAEFVLNGESGKGLIIADRNRVLFKNEVPKDYYIYELNKTSKEHQNTDL